MKYQMSMVEDKNRYNKKYHQVDLHSIMVAPKEKNITTQTVSGMIEKWIRHNLA